METPEAIVLLLGVLQAIRSVFGLGVFSELPPVTIEKRHYYSKETASLDGRTTGIVGYGYGRQTCR